MTKAALAVLLFTTVCFAQTLHFGHVIILFQENRTPDNLFYGLCGTYGTCATPPGTQQYNIQAANWLDDTALNGVRQPQPQHLVNTYDLGHDHSSWVAQYDGGRMDGASGVSCLPSDQCALTPNPAFQYVPATDVTPYLTMASQYGWGNYMFQTNEGPSFEAHQYIFTGTSAASDADDAAGHFMAENAGNSEQGNSTCFSPLGSFIQQIDAYGNEARSDTIYPCVEHQTLSDLLESKGVSWRYYAPGTGGLWVAPAAIAHICGSDGTKCAGSDFTANVVSKSAQVLTDIANCNLAQVTWVNPTGNNSDHPRDNTGGGPSWIASIVNALGNSWRTSNKKCDYWSTNTNEPTAIILTWDDWGGWYDHEPPTVLPFPQGGYQMGFRVPLVVMSAFTPQAFISNQREDFGSIARFIEQNFGIAEGALNYADARSTSDLTEYFSLTSPRMFFKIPSQKGADFFINDPTPQTPPDDY